MLRPADLVSQTVHFDSHSGLCRSTSLFAKYYAPKRYRTGVINLAKNMLASPVHGTSIRHPAISCDIQDDYSAWNELCVLRYMRGLHHKPKRLPMSFWGWILPVYRTDEEEMIRVAGFDAATYMRIITFGAKTACGVA